MRRLFCVLSIILACCGDDDDPRTERDAGASDAATHTEHDGSMREDTQTMTMQSCQRTQFRESELAVFELNVDIGVARKIVPIETPATFAGIVTAHGTGFPAFDAPPNAMLDDVTDLRFIRIASENRIWTVVARNLPDFRVRERAQITIEVHSKPKPGNAAERWLLIRENDKTVFFFGQADAFDDLPEVPGFKFAAGKLLCTLKNVCGDVGTYELTATLPTETQLTLKPNQTLERDGFSVTHRETRMLASTAACDDYNPSSTQLVIARSQPTDGGAFECKTSSLSSLPGVRVEFPNDVPCRFTLGQAKDGIEVPYRIVVDQDLPGFAGTPPDIGDCLVPDAGQIEPLATLSGNNQFYGVTDVGGCVGNQPLEIGTLAKGTYPWKFKWDGVNWFGPSDSGGEKGKPFPAGLYTLKVTAGGYYDIADGEQADAGTPGEVVGTLGVLLSD